MYGLLLEEIGHRPCGEVGSNQQANECARDRRQLVYEAASAGSQKKTAIRSGGHNTAGYSVNDQLVIDVSRVPKLPQPEHATRCVSAAVLG